MAIFPASHYATGRDKLVKALGEIEHDMQVRVEEFKAEDKLIEAQRIEQRTTYDMEMMREIGYCQGIENYSLTAASRVSLHIRCSTISPRTFL